ncbi:hypothetical protein Mapa_000969 [Marchantia paleacea]|nr:hypothetical protein Mapa_000969 [Marchantia paleacea]
MSPSMKRAVHSCMGRLAVLSHRQGVAGHSLLPALSSRFARCAALPSKDVILLRAQPMKLEYGVAFVSVRFLGSTQLCAVETPEENDWQKVEFLVSCSFTKEQAMQVLKQCPLLLSLSLEEELHPKIAFLRTLGVRDLPKGHPQAAKFYDGLGP